MIGVDVYHVGILRDLRFAYRAARRGAPRRYVWSPLRNAARTIARHVKARDWHALKCSFNGYLAEPDVWPPGLTRCGTGWTERRAVRDLDRRIAKATR